MHRGVRAPSVRKPTVRTADEGRSGPVLRQNPPIFKPRLETLRIILASNPPCAQCAPPSRRILRNKSGVYPGGPHCAKYRSQRPSVGRKRASLLEWTGPSILRPTRYRRFSRGWGCYPLEAVRCVGRGYVRSIGIRPAREKAPGSRGKPRGRRKRRVPSLSAPSGADMRILPNVPDVQGSERAIRPIRLRYRRSLMRPRA